MSKIFEYTNSISLNRTARIRRSISNSGYARQERGSPTFYSMEVNLPLLTKAKYDELTKLLYSTFDRPDEFDKIWKQREQLKKDLTSLYL